MNHSHRRNQADVLQELFNEGTTGCTPDKKVMWLLDLFGDHAGRLVGVTQSLERPLDSTFFESDFINNLLLVSSLIQRELRATKDSRSLGSLWQIVASSLDSIVNNKNETQIDELANVFEETRQTMSELLGEKSTET